MNRYTETVPCSSRNGNDGNSESFQGVWSKSEAVVEFVNDTVAGDGSYHAEENKEES